MIQSLCKHYKLEDQGGTDKDNWVSTEHNLALNAGKQGVNIYQVIPG